MYAEIWISRHLQSASTKRSAISPCPRARRQVPIDVGRAFLTGSSTPVATDDCTASTRHQWRHAPSLLLQVSLRPARVIQESSGNHCVDHGQIRRCKNALRCRAADQILCHPARGAVTVFINPGPAAPMQVVSFPLSPLSPLLRAPPVREWLSARCSFPHSRSCPSPPSSRRARARRCG